MHFLQLYIKYMFSDFNVTQPNITPCIYCFSVNDGEYLGSIRALHLSPAGVIRASLNFEEEEEG